MSLTLARASRASQPRHAHDSLVLGVVLAGARRIETGGTSTRVPQGAVSVLTPGQAHACAPAESAAQADAAVNDTINDTIQASSNAAINAAINVTINAQADAGRCGKPGPGAAARTWACGAPHDAFDAASHAVSHDTFDAASNDTDDDTDDAISGGMAKGASRGAAHAGADAGAGTAANSCSYLALGIAPEALPPELAGWRAGSPRLDDPALARALIRLAEALDAPTGRLERQSLLAECLELLARHGGCGNSLHGGAGTGQEGGRGALAATARMRAAAGEARRLIEENLETGVDLAALAAACGVDMFALHRAFTRELGLPPHSYQTHLRLRRAKELLRAGASLAEAALASGFCDQAHMTRHFGRVVGLSPARYAKAHTGSGGPDGRGGGRSG